ncbi:MAG: nucleotidyltransferase family protein [Vicinamibacterales bacterium]
MISAVVLAAGLSTRMGGAPKALLAFDERDTFVTRIVRTFVEAGIADIVVVVGHDALRVRAVLEESGLPARVVVNAAYRQGQFSSLLAGLDAVDRPDLDALLLTLVDAPLFAASTVDAVVRRFEESSAPVVRAVCGSEHGHPVLIARRLFAAIRECDPNAGAKSVVRGHASAAGDVPVDDPGAYIDIDTPAEYAALPELRRQLGR